MKTRVWILATIAILLFAISASAQGIYQEPRMLNQVGLTAIIAPSRMSLDLREDWSGSKSHNRLEIGAVGLLRDLVRIRYTAIMGRDFQDSFVPTGAFLVGGQNLGKDPSSSGSSDSDQTPKPVTLDWKIRPEHRLEAEIIWNLCPIRPAITANWVNVSLDASTEKQGKLTAASEEWKKGFLGFGGVLQYEITNMRVSVKAVAGKDFRRVEGIILWTIIPGTALQLGGYDEMKDPGTKIQERGGIIGLISLF